MSTIDDPPEPTTPVLSDPRRDASEAVTWPIRVAAAWTWRLILIGAGILVFVKIFARIELVAFSFVLALFLTAVLHPIERLLRRRMGGPRSLPAAIALLFGIAALGGIATFVVWQISTHSSELSDQISDSITNLQHWLETGPLHVKSSDLSKLSANVTSALQKNQGELISGAIETVRTVAEGLTALLLILLTTFFLLRDGADIWQWALRLLPSAAHDRVNIAGYAGWHTFGGYMRGVVLIALFHGVSAMIVMFILRVPLAAALGVLIFLGAFIPIIGLVIAGTFAVLIALLEHGLTPAIVLAIAIIVLVQLETHLLQPLIMSRSVEVHPLAIALSVLTGTILAGIPGALLAVPLVAFINSTGHALRETPAFPMGDSGFPVKHREEVGGDSVDATKPVGEGKTQGQHDADVEHAEQAERDVQEALEAESEPEGSLRLADEIVDRPAERSEQQ